MDFSFEGPLGEERRGLFGWWWAVSSKVLGGNARELIERLGGWSWILGLVGNRGMMVLGCAFSGLRGVDLPVFGSDKGSSGGCVASLFLERVDRNSSVASPFQ